VASPLEMRGGSVITTVMGQDTSRGHGSGGPNLAWPRCPPKVELGPTSPVQRQKSKETKARFWAPAHPSPFVSANLSFHPTTLSSKFWGLVMQVPDLEPRIHAILSAPGTDLSTISAKRVRRLLLEQEDIPQELIKDNKQAIDEIIANVFARVSEEKGFQQDEEEGDAEGRRTPSAESPAASKKRRRTSIVDHNDRSSAKAAKSSTAGDEALARKLSEQINGRERSSRSTASNASPIRGSRGRARGKARGRGKGNKANGARSADTIDDSGNEGSEGDESKKKKGGGLSKEYILRCVRRLAPLSHHTSHS
jgi:upstream activation factor subunit UAF30